MSVLAFLAWFSGSALDGRGSSLLTADIGLDNAGSLVNNISGLIY